MKTYFSVLLLLSSLFIQAQVDIESRVKRRVTCDDVSFYAWENIPLYYQDGHFDSIEYVVNFWSTKCASRLDISATQKLLKIEQGLAREIIANEELLDELIAFSDTEFGRYPDEHFIFNHLENFNVDPDYKEFMHFYSNYLHFLKYWASQLKTWTLNKYSDTYGILLSYSGNSELFFEWLNQGHKESKLSSIYIERVNYYSSLPDNDGGVFIEYWNPYGNLSLLGPHPGLGGYIGSVRKWGFYRGTMAFRFLKSANTYLAKDRGVVEESKNFLGGYFMFHTGVKIISEGSFTSHLVGGLGIDIIDVLKSDNDDPGSGKSIASFNPTIGWASRVKLSRSQYVAVEAEYNFLSYVNKGGSDFSGHALSVKLIYGWLWNYRKDRNLRWLRQ